MTTTDSTTGPRFNPLQKGAARWAGRLLLLGVGAAGGYWWGTTPGRPPVNPQAPVLSTLALMDKKLDLLWSQGSSTLQAVQGPGEGAVVELPPLAVDGGSVRFRFKRIGDRCHYEVSLEGSIDAISRVVAPHGKTSLLKATFVDADHFDLTDLTLPGGQFLIQQPGDGGESVALNQQGLWESKVDPAKIKGWRLEVLEGSPGETAAASPTPNPQVAKLAADITVQPATGRWVLPESLRNVQEPVAPAATPMPAGGVPTFQPPASMPTPLPGPGGGAPGTSVLPAEAKGKS